MSQTKMSKESKAAAKPIKPFKWTEKDAQEASSRHRYIRVSTDKKPTERLLSSAVTMWKKPGNENDIFVHGYWISGPPKCVSEALIGATVNGQELTADVVNRIITTNVYTKDNYASNPGVEREIAEYKEWAKSNGQKETDNEVNLGDVIALAKGLSGAKEVSKGASKATASSPGRRGPTSTLSAKLKELKDDKVIDVSKLGDSGTGARTIVPPGAKAKKYRGGTLPVVSSNADKYRMALDMLAKEGYALPSSVESLMKDFMSKMDGKPATVSRAQVPKAAKGKTKATSSKTAEIPVVNVSSGSSSSSSSSSSSAFQRSPVRTISARSPIPNFHKIPEVRSITSK